MTYKMEASTQISILVSLISVFIFGVACNRHTSKHQTAKESESIDEVHVIFMNHLDVGYNGVNPKIGFINVVLNRYFTEHFPKAINLTRDLKEKGYTETFIYTTHPWLVYLFLNCPENFTLSGVTLKCPSEPLRTAFTEALQNGDITYHAGPMNMQPENMNEMLFELSLNISQNLDEAFSLKRTFRTLSQRDVPGMTKAVIPILLRKGIVALSVGVNSGTSPPAVPNIFTWRFDDDHEVIAMWHPGGYPDNPGVDPSHPGGLSRKDCITIDNFSKALCFAFRTDNAGPPINVEEIIGYYEILRAEFPGAKLIASTFEKFVEAVQPIRKQLPVITNEIGDTWISGIASDPRKMAEYRVVTQTLTDCINNGKCDTKDTRVLDAVFFLIKPGEHTWGLPSVYDAANWTNKDFYSAKSGMNYINCTRAWLEQRQFTFLAIERLGDHPIVKEIDQNLKKLVPVKPSLEGFEEVDPGQEFTHKDGVVIRFSSDGSIGHLYDPFNQENWAKSNNFGRFLYRTYDEGDFNVTNEQYHYSWWIFTKPNLTVGANPKSFVWETQLEKLYKSSGMDFTFLVKIVMRDPVPHSTYGAPGEVWIKYTYTEDLSNGNPGFAVNLQWFDKTPTRLPESLMYYFTPLPPIPKHGETRTSAFSSEWDMEQQSRGHAPYSTFRHTKDNFGNMKYSAKDYSWKLRKLGSLIDPSNIVLNGSQYLHAVDSEVHYTTADGSGLHVVTQDVPLVSLGTFQTAPSPFPVPLSTIEQGQITGFAFNMYNNMWDTNYVVWYPFYEGDEDFSARFYIVFHTN